MGKDFDSKGASMGRIPVWLLVAGMLLAAGELSGAQGLRDGVKDGVGAQRQGSLRYVNPLSVEDSIGLGDPTVVRFKGTYYLVCHRRCGE